MPYKSIKTNIADSLNIIVQMERRPGARFVSEVLEIRGYSSASDQYQFGQAYGGIEIDDLPSSRKRQ
jgi:Flp pilus assembly CpaF family ATPase